MSWIQQIFEYHVLELVINIHLYILFVVEIKQN